MDNYGVSKDKSSNTISSTRIYNYYNESMNPINKFINCHFIQSSYTSKCFYINKDNEIIEVDHRVSGNNAYGTFKSAKLKDSNFIDNNTIIMSSIIKYLN